MAERPSPEDPNKKLVDALLKKLPHAEPDRSAPGGPGRPAAPGGPARRAAVTREPQVGRARPDRPTPAGVWTRVGLGLLLAVAITQWPYAKDCGWALTGYSTAVIAVLATAGWASVFTWRAQLGAAHLLALGTLVFGLGLVASVALPRSGYARNAATWTCGPESAETTVPATDAPAAAPGMVPAVTDSLTPPDSTAADSAAPDSSFAVGVPAADPDS